MLRKSDSAESRRGSKLRLGLFGATRSGKTVYLTTLYWLSKKGGLPAGVSGLLPADANSAQYLGERYAMIEAGQWPAGNLDSQQIALDISSGSKVITLATNDFRGGDFTAAFYSGDPSGRRRAEEFVAKLFEGCSAYIFLVDAGDVRESLNSENSVEAKQTVASRLGAIETTLSILRKNAWGLRPFHHPVAVVFTKGDLHPECMADAEAYAKRHARPTWDYLKEHAHARHQFFGISSTGTVPAGAGGPPLPLWPSPNFFEPILWCIDQHRQQIRLKWKIASTVATLLLFGIWIALTVINHGRLARAAGEVPTAQDQRLRELYTEVNGWWSWSPWDSPWAVAQQVLAEAENRFQATAANRRDQLGNLRTADDYNETDRDVSRFRDSYPGTENAARLSEWINAQRRLIARRLLDELSASAADGNERKFDDTLREYEKVALPDLGAEVEGAGKELSKRIVGDQVRQLWRKWVADPGDVDGIREKCRLAEDVIGRRPSDKRHQEFVGLMRNVYDQLKESRLVKVSFHVTAADDHKVSWWLMVNESPSIKSNPEWVTPQRLSEGRFEIEGATTSVDFLETRGIRVAFNVSYWLSKAQLSTPKYSLNQFSAASAQPVRLRTDGGVIYDVFLEGDSQLKDYCRALARIRELADELFQSAKSAS